MLGRLIGDGDQIARALLAHVAGRELGIARHDLLGRHLDDQPADRLGIDGPGAAWADHA